MKRETIHEPVIKNFNVLFNFYYLMSKLIYFEGDLMEEVTQCHISDFLLKATYITI